MIFNDFAKAMGQMGDPRFNRVLGLGVGLTVALLVAVYAVFMIVVDWIMPDQFTIPFIGTIEWIDNLVSWASAILMIWFSTFLMAPVASAFTGLFLEDVAAAVEDTHYGHLPRAAPIPFAEGVKDALGFLGVMIVANLVALLFYMVFTVFSPLIFWSLNGYLLGREYFQLVAMRRLGREGARKLRARHGLVIWLAGILMAMPLSVPIVNLFIPVLGVATFTHLFHRLQTEDPSRF